MSISHRGAARLIAATGTASFAIDLTFLLALFGAICGPYLFRVHETALPGGWDGVPHYAIADLYARRLFPALSGWTPEYFAGMPFPNFYPPTFYLIVATLTRLGLPLRTAFLGVQTIASIAVPLLTYLCARRLAQSRIAGLVAGALVTGALVDKNPLWAAGISLPSTFDAGLSTQLLGHCLLLLFYHSLLNADRRLASAALAALWFGLVVVTNVHLVWAAAFLFVPLGVARILSAHSIRSRARLLALHAAIGATAVLVSAAWVLPMIANLDFVPTLALPTAAPGAIALAFARLGIYLIFGALAAALKRDQRALAFASTLALLIAFTVLPSARWLGLENLALQPWRIVIPFAFLMPVLIGYFVSIAGDIVRWPHTRLVAGLACSTLFFLHFKIVTKPEANITESQIASYEGALHALGGRSDGRVLVEMGTASISDPFALQALAGASGAHALTTVFRESALNVLLAVPLRNSFSTSQEAFGVDHKINGSVFAADLPSRHLARLQLFNVQYFAAQSDDQKARLKNFPGVRRTSPPGEWELYEFETEAPGYATIPAFEPVLTFAPFSVKLRPDDGLDFVRLGEEMFAASRLDVPLARTRCPTLDDCDDWDRFQTALLIETPYRNMKRAFDAIERFSRDKHVVILSSQDPLVAALAELVRPTIHIVDAPAPLAATKEARLQWARQTSALVFEAIDAVREPLRGVPSIASTELDGGRTDITLDGQPDRRIPIWVRQGYFPNWTNEEGEPVYLATPTFQLTFTRRRQVELRFEHTAVEWMGMLLSIAGLAMVVAGLVVAVYGAAHRSRH